MNYKPNRLKTKEEKKSEKWEKRGRPRIFHDGRKGTYTNPNKRKEQK